MNDENRMNMIYQLIAYNYKLMVKLISTKYLY